MRHHDHHTLSALFDEYLSAHQPYGSPDSLYEPMRYINEIGGKRIRPVLLLMAYNTWHEDVTPALPAAMAVEYFHQFSLMHDDIMDEAPLRRGRESVHQKFGRNAAILSGDAMLIRCFDLLLQAGQKSGTGEQLCSHMCRVALEICEGQQLDMDFESLDAPVESAYIEMIRKKTACLIGLSLQLGALLAGAPEQEAMALYSFGENIGLGFQIQDDYLDTFGDSQMTGKQRGGDILQHKKNFLFVRTYNILTPPERVAFAESYGQVSGEEDLLPILDLYEKQQIGEYASQMQSLYFQKALEQLDALESNPNQSLRSFSQSMVDRKY
jgi:geranylgeranyl diphosphate synthase type II